MPVQSGVETERLSSEREKRPGGGGRECNCLWIENRNQGIELTGGGKNAL